MNSGDKILENLKSITVHVRPIIDQPLDGQPVAFKVRQKLGAHALEFFKALSQYTSRLVEVKSGKRLMLKENADLVPEHCRSAPELDQNVLYVELLTAAWLGLYFLGVPDGRPWDMVLRWTEEHGGGLPNGICVGKAIGDLVRRSRRTHAEFDHGQPFQPTGRPPGDLLVHSYLPMIVFPSLVDTGSGPPGIPSERSSLPSELHALGRSYEFLQLRLYANAGYPFMYSIPRRFVATLLARDMTTNPNTGKKLHAAIVRICKELRARVAQDQNSTDFEKARQRIVIVDQDRPPACFVNDESGLFTFEGIDATDKSQNLPLPASYMRAERRRRYRDRLVSGEPKIGQPPKPDRSRNLLLADSTAIFQMLRNDPELADAYHGEGSESEGDVTTG